MEPSAPAECVKWVRGDMEKRWLAGFSENRLDAEFKQEGIEAWSTEDGNICLQVGGSYCQLGLPGVKLKYVGWNNKTHEAQDHSYFRLDGSDGGKYFIYDVHDPFNASLWRGPKYGTVLDAPDPNAVPLAGVDMKTPRFLDGVLTVVGGTLIKNRASRRYPRKSRKVAGPPN